MLQSPRVSTHCAYCTWPAVAKSPGLTPRVMSAAWVDALIVFAVGFARFKCSYATKKKNLSLMTGPPALPTKSSTWRLGLITPPGRLGLQVLRIGQELAALGRQRYCADP